MHEAGHPVGRRIARAHRCSPPHRRPSSIMAVGQRAQQRCQTVLQCTYPPHARRRCLFGRPCTSIQSAASSVERVINNLPHQHQKPRHPNHKHYYQPGHSRTHQGHLYKSVSNASAALRAHLQYEAPANLSV